MATTEASLKKFFESPKYAVVGASTNTAKFGFKVFRWYILHGLEAVPINPIASEIEVDGKAHAVVPSLSQLENPAETAISIITPPAITLKTLKEARDLGVPAVFLQPGTFDDEVLQFARDNIQTVVAGADGGWGSEGWCILVDGERGLKGVGKL
ncbi:CoA binding domain-containing protein [Lasiosphaeris hirsuta]|uniref:CoA binding domain-containing protein n=1 Tax=Lasiosphaeris hirsuta TaxID=260670 RepID=A0AA40DTE9_9PEZI|nr:CoA binding domain-containing protein [Lasiosphaeris hirsuta]